MDEYPVPPDHRDLRGGRRAATRSGTTATTSARPTSPATVSLTSNVRLYQNNDVLDGFVCVRHDGRQHNVRLSRRLRPDMDHLGVGPLRLDIVEPMRGGAARARGQRLRDHPRRHLPHRRSCRTRTRSRSPGSTAGCSASALTYELTGGCEGWVQIGDQRIELTPAPTSFFRNHSWGYQAGRGGPRLVRRAVGRPQPPAGRACASGCCSTCPTTAATTSCTTRRTASGRSGTAAIMLRRPHRAGRRRAARAPVLRGRPAAARAAAFTLTDAEGVVRVVRARATSAGSTARAAGTSAASTTASARACTAATTTRRARCGTCRHPTDVVGPDGKTFELDHAWAENFMTMRSGDATGLAHFECVVFGG